MADLAGAVLWGVVPYVPQQPVSLYVGEDRAPVKVSDVPRFIAAARQAGESDYVFLTEGKVRPVLVLAEAADPRISEVLGLRLHQLRKSEAADKERIREQRDPLLFYLQPDCFPDLDENAAMMAGLVRAHVSALDPSTIEGRLGKNDLRDVHERVVRHYGFDLNRLVLAELERLAEAQRRQR